MMLASSLLGLSPARQVYFHHAQLKLKPIHTQAYLAPGFEIQFLPLLLACHHPPQQPLLT